jgi:uncharacterized membrane protein
MKKSTILTALTSAIALISTTAFAAEEFEKCTVIKNGKGLIKEHKADCKGASHSCAGQNKAGDPESWISVPKGQCDKINKGNFEGIDPKIKDKIESDKI